MCFTFQYTFIWKTIKTNLTNSISIRCDLCIILFAVDKMLIIKQVLLGLLRTGHLGLYNLRACVFLIFLSDFTYFRIINYKWSQDWNLRKVVLSQDMLVFDLVNEQGFISLEKNTQILLNVTVIFSQVKTLSCLAAFAYNFSEPRVHFSPLWLSSSGLSSYDL